jgi:hypothetical protein
MIRWTKHVSHVWKTKKVQNTVLEKSIKTWDDKIRILHVQLLVRRYFCPTRVRFCDSFDATLSSILDLFLFFNSVPIITYLICDAMTRSYDEKTRFGPRLLEGCLCLIKIDVEEMC